MPRHQSGLTANHRAQTFRSPSKLPETQLLILQRRQDQIASPIEIAFFLTTIALAVLLPVEYTAFIWAAIMGWLFFAEAATPAVLAGAALIVTGCVVAARARPQPLAALEGAT